MPQPSSMMEHEEDVRIVLKRMFEGEESHSAKTGVIFHKTVFVLFCLPSAELYETEVCYTWKDLFMYIYRYIYMYLKKN